MSSKSLLEPENEARGFPRVVSYNGRDHCAGTVSLKACKGERSTRRHVLCNKKAHSTLAFLSSPSPGFSNQEDFEKINVQSLQYENNTHLFSKYKVIAKY